MPSSASEGFFARSSIYRMLEGTPAHPVRRAVRIGLAVLIVLNVTAVIVESIDEIGETYRGLFFTFELFSIAVFTTEYLLRVWACVEDPRYAGPGGRLRFVRSPMALLDLIAIAPFFLGSLLSVDTRVLRALRLLRILKLSRHSTSMDLLLTVFRQEFSSVMSAMFVMVIVIILAASGIYVIERGSNPEAFGSIPKAMWWATVTLTTVGYGDVVPQTVIGKIFGVAITLAGVGMVALPAGILASGFSLELQRRREEFRLEVKRALEDGAVAPGEAMDLAAERGELGLSEEDANLLIREEELEAASHPARCPHCGKAVS